MTKPSKPGSTERAGIVVTNLIKLGGLVVAVHEALAVAEPRPIVLGVAALMMAGAQSLETFLGAFFGAGRSE